MESFGRYLRNEREQRGVSLADIARSTKIGEAQLRSLEADDLAALPTTPYVKGFIRAYSKHLGIDPNDALLRFEDYLKQIEQEEGGISQDFPSTGFRKDTPHIGFLVAASGIILLVIVILLVLIRACGHRNPENSVKSLNPGNGVILTQQKSPPLEINNPDEIGILSSPNEETGQDITPPIPILPPESFRITRTAAPFTNIGPGGLSTRDVSKIPDGGGSSSR
jgi:cytoskeletal protein RodZ